MEKDKSFVIFLIEIVIPLFLLITLILFTVPLLVVLYDLWIQALGYPAVDKNTVLMWKIQ